MKSDNVGTSSGKGCARVFMITAGGLAGTFVALVVVTVVADQIKLSKMTPAERAQYIADRDAQYAKDRAEAKTARDREKVKTTNKIAAEAAAKDRADNPPAIVKIQAVFRGSYGPEDTKTEVDEVLKLYDQPLSEEAYTRFGDVVAYQAEHHLTIEMKIVRCMKDVKTRSSPITWTIERAAGFCATGETLPNFDSVFGWDSPVCEYISDVDKAINLSQTGNLTMVETQTSCVYVPEGTPAVSLDFAGGYYQQVIILDDQGQLLQRWTSAQLLQSRH